MKHRSRSSLGFDPERFRQLFEGNHLKVSESQVELFQIYYDQLLTWNSRAGLVSKKDEMRLQERHFLESSMLAGFQEFHDKVTVLDLGTGGGFPGLPLKIMCPWLEVVLLDSKRKKCLFLKDVVKKLGLDVEVLCERVEKVEREGIYALSFGIVVSRAVTSLNLLYQLSSPLLRAGGKLVAIKGSKASAELGVLESRCPGVVGRIKPLFRGQAGKGKPVVVLISKSV